MLHFEGPPAAFLRRGSNVGVHLSKTKSVSFSHYTWNSSDLLTLIMTNPSFNLIYTTCLFCGRVSQWNVLLTLCLWNWILINYPENYLECSGVYNYSKQHAYDQIPVFDATNKACLPLHLFWRSLLGCARFATRSRGLLGLVVAAIGGSLKAVNAGKADKRSVR